MAGNNRFSEEYLREAEKRIEEMEAPDYVFPEEFSKANWIAAYITIAVTGILLVAGAWM